MNSLLEQVNSLIKMQVGDPYRLEHIKSRLEKNKILTLSDTKYLNVLLDRYNRDVENKESQTSKSKPIKFSGLNSEKNICWKCGQGNPNFAKFCNSCGNPLAKSSEKPEITSEKPEITSEKPEITSEKPEITSEKPKKIPKKQSKENQSWIQTRSTTMPKRMGKGKKISIGIGVIIILVVIIGLLEGDQFLAGFENIFKNLQERLGSFLEGFSTNLPNF